MKTNQVTSIAVSILMAVGLSACNATDLMAKKSAVQTTTTYTPIAKPSALVLQTTIPTPGSTFAAILKATTLSKESVFVDGTSSTSPLPSAVAVPLRPPGAGPNATSFQTNNATTAIAQWHTTRAKDILVAQHSTQAALRSWSEKVSQSIPTIVPVSAGTLASALANAQSDFVTEAQNGASVGPRVVVVATDNYTAPSLPAGSASQDTVIIVGPQGSSPSTVEIAQLDAQLISAGAIRVVIAPSNDFSLITQSIIAGLRTTATEDSLAGSTLFANNSAVLSSSATGQLEPIANELVHNPNASAIVTGYASATGLPGANLSLSQLRAQSVANFITSAGVSPSRLYAIGEGATHFIAAPDSGLNRRVVIEIVN
ncbi:MAG: OmpA family protein [Ferrimicrobium sp.]